MLAPLLIINIILTIIAFIAFLLSLSVLIELGRLAPFGSSSPYTKALVASLVSFIVIIVVMIYLAVATAVPYIPLVGTAPKNYSNLSESEKIENINQRLAPGNEERTSAFKWFSLASFILAAGTGSLLFYPLLLINNLSPTTQTNTAYQLTITGIVLFYIIALVSLGEFIYLVGPGKKYDYYPALS